MPTANPFGSGKRGAPGKWLLIVVFSGAALLSGCGYQSGHMYDTRLPASFRSNGERIYFTGTSERNTAIVFAGGGMHMQMMGGSCASCHGADRRGGIRMMPFFWRTAPPLTAEALFDRHAKEDGHGNHDVYDDDALRRVISTGVDPSNRTLDNLMPRWHMSDPDMDDLISFLKS